MKRASMAAAGIALLGMTGAAHAVTTINITNWENVSGNGSPDASGQFNLAITGDETNVNKVIGFTFTNFGPIASSITDIYFDDGGPPAGGQFDEASLAIGPQTGSVSFSVGASPANLPSGGAFAASVGADSNPAVALNGIGNYAGALPPAPGSFDSLTMFMTLLPSATWQSFLLAGFLDYFQIGMHVQAYSNGGSESFINGGGSGGFPDPQVVVPIPAGIWLFGTALAGLGALKMRSRQRKQTPMMTA